MIFAVRAEKPILEYMDEFQHNLETRMMANRFFMGKFYYVNETVYVLDIGFLLPLPTVIFIIGLLCGFAFNIQWLWISCLSIVAFLYSIQSHFFYYYMMKLGLRKLGCKVKVKILSREETIRVLCEELRTWQ